MGVLLTSDTDLEDASEGSALKTEILHTDWLHSNPYAHSINRQKEVQNEQK